MMGTITAGRLVFLERDTFDSLYRRSDGTTVQIPHGWTTKYEVDEDVLAELWGRFTPPRKKCSCGCGVMFEDYRNIFTFREFLRSVLVDPDQADSVVQCVDCQVVGDSEVGDWSDLYDGDSWVCGSCVQNYTTCEDCDGLTRYTSTTLSGRDICEGCRDNNYRYCEHCDGYYHEEDDDAGDHGRHEDCDCEAPAQSFTMRNDGDEPLRNDTRVTVSLPAGTISGEGMDQISQFLRSEADRHRPTYDMTPEEQAARAAQYDALWGLSWDLGSLGDQWQTREGNFAKRLSRLAYKSRALKLEQGVLSQVGCIARDHSTAVDFQIEITRNLNLPPEDFYHEDSCWWQSYSESRCALKNNGGLGLRTFADGDGVTGRAWLLPLALDEFGNLEPTFDTETPAAYVVFNGYGKLGGYTPARIVSHMTGWTYRKIAFDCNPMYINNCTGYLVAPEDLASRYTDGRLSLSVDAHSTLFADTQKELVNV